MRLHIALAATLAWSAAARAGSAAAPPARGEDKAIRQEELRGLMGMADLVAAGSSVGGGWVLGFEPHQLKGEQGQT